MIGVNTANLRREGPPAGLGIRRSYGRAPYRTASEAPGRHPRTAFKDTTLRRPTRDVCRPPPPSRRSGAIMGDG